MDDLLTPAEIHNVAFRKPPLGKRGYDEEEVDAFLDRVERTLTTLSAENSRLRELNQRQGLAESAAAMPDQHAVLTELDLIKTRLARIEAAVTGRGGIRSAVADPTLGGLP